MAVHLNGHSSALHARHRGVPNVFKPLMSIKPAAGKSSSPVAHEKGNA